MTSRFETIHLPFIGLLVLQSFFLSNLSFAASVPQVCHQDTCVLTEVISKKEDMERGLMYRKGLGKDKGMLFAFSDDGVHLFWMKNMSFSLDIIWISKNGRIVFIGHHIPPCKADLCPIYASDKPSRYVLELNSGYAGSHGWRVGDHLDFHLL